MVESGFEVLDPQLLEHLRLGLVFLAAIRADAADEPLGAREDNGGGDEEGLDAHVIETGDGAGGVIGMERGEDLVAGERGFHGNVRRLVIANFTDHHDVRVLPQNGAQGTGKGEADIFFCGNLIDSGNLEFDRVFNGDNVVNRAVEFVERRVKRCV